MTTITGDDYVADLSAWAARAAREGRIAALAVGGSLSTGEAVVEHPLGVAPDADLFLFSPRGERARAVEEINAISSAIQAHVHWSSEVGPPLSSNYGTATVRAQQTVFPFDLAVLGRFPSWQSIPVPDEPLRLLWNRWSFALATSRSPASLIKIGCDLGTILLHLRGQFYPSYSRRLEAITNFAWRDSAVASVAVDALNARLGRGAGCVPSCSRLVEATREVVGLLGISPGALAAAARKRALVPSWSRRLLAGGGAAILVRSATGLRSIINTRLNAMEVVFAHLTDAAFDPCDEDATLPRSLRSAVDYWAWETDL